MIIQELSREENQVWGGTAWSAYPGSRVDLGKDAEIGNRLKMTRKDFQMTPGKAGPGYLGLVNLGNVCSRSSDRVLNPICKSLGNLKYYVLLEENKGINADGVDLGGRMSGGLWLLLFPLQTET